jgi:hypothetical protein
MRDKRVIMRSFLGTTIPGADVESRENYWQLIGKRGKVINATENIDGRVLVLFEDNLDDYGLENHNPIKNSVWIRSADLIAVN